MITRDVVIPTKRGDIPGILVRPQDARWLCVLAHGAGAGMRHTFMEDASAAFAREGVATLRYEFPYVTAGSRRPDPAPLLQSCVRSVVGWAGREEPSLRIAAGGKSMGGRMTSQAQADAPLERVERLVFLGFPLHPAGAPAITRAAHLDAVLLPMLFLQGDRDALADLTLMRGVAEQLGPRATLHVCTGADHGFHVLKRSGRSDADVLEELARTTRAWLDAA